MTSDKLFAPRRIGVCGSSQRESSHFIPFCAAVGTALAEDDNIVIVSGGTRKKIIGLVADWHIVDSARQRLLERSGPDLVAQRIETVLPGDTVFDPEKQFQVGSLRPARGKTSESRRFSFVRSLDGLLAVSGSCGTAQEIALAFELGTPVLPVPVFGGQSRKFWDLYKPDLMQMLRLDQTIADHWSKKPSGGRLGVQQLASEMVKVLLKALPRICFVIMPFSEKYDGLYDNVIMPVARRFGHAVNRLDRTAKPGDTGHQIHEGIEHCDYVIAVLDDLRPNVLYELGLAHANRKPSILMNRIGSLGDGSAVPFDISMQQRLEYDTVESGLANRLERAIRSLPPERIYKRSRAEART